MLIFSRGCSGNSCGFGVAASKPAPVRADPTRPPRLISHRPGDVRARAPARGASFPPGVLGVSAQPASARSARWKSLRTRVADHRPCLGDAGGGSSWRPAVSPPSTTWSGCHRDSMPVHKQRPRFTNVNRGRLHHRGSPLDASHLEGGVAPERRGPETWEVLLVSGSIWLSTPSFRPH